MEHARSRAFGRGRAERAQNRPENEPSYAAVRRHGKICPKQIDRRRLAARWDGKRPPGVEEEARCVLEGAQSLG